MPLTLVAEVCTSGTGVAIAAKDGSGNPVQIIGVNNNAQQTLRVDADQGTMTLTFGGQTTSAIAVRATPDVIQTAFQALSSVGSGNALVSGFGQPYQIDFAGALAGAAQSPIVATPSGLVGTLPSVPAVPGVTTATVHTGDGGFSKTGTGWTIGFSSQSDNWFRAPGGGVGLNVAHYAVTGLATGLYAVSAMAVDPAQTTGLGDTNAGVGTLARYRLYDGTTYRGTVTVNPRVDNTAQHGSTQIASVYVASGTLHAYTADDADCGGQLYVGPLTVAPAYTQLDYYVTLGSFSAPTGWPYGSAARSVATQFTCPALGTARAIFHYGSYSSGACDVLYLTAAGKLAYKNFDGNIYTGSTTLTPGTAYTAVYTIDGAGNGSISLNAVAETMSGTAWLPTTLQGSTFANAGIGLSIYGDRLGVLPWTERIGRVGVWSRVLTSGEITAWHNGGSSPTFAGLTSTLPTGVVGYYDLDPANPGVDGKAVNAFYAYYGQKPAETYGSPGVTVTPTRTGGPLPFHVTGAGAGITLDAQPVWSPSSVSLYWRDWVYFRTAGNALLSGSDVATVDIPAGVIVTTAGVVPAVNGLAVTNLSGLPMNPTAPPSVRSLKVGFNVFTPDFTSGLQPYANLMMSGSQWQGSPVAVALDANGYPNAEFTNGGTVPQLFKLISQSNSAGPDARGEPLQQFGHYTLLWDGNEPGLTLANYTRGGSFATGETVTWDAVSNSDNTATTQVNNKRVVNFVAGRELSFYGATPPVYDPTVVLRYPSNATFKSARNIRIFPPSVADPLNPPLFNPTFVNMAKGSRVFRTMTWFGINGATWCDYADFRNSGEIPERQRDRHIGISLFEPYSAGVYSYPAGSNYTGTVLKVTTTAPHGLRTGSTLGAYRADGLNPYNHYDNTVPGYNGGTFSAYLQNGAGLIYVLDATHFVLGVNTVPGFTPFTPNDMIFISNPSTTSYVDALAFNNAIADSRGPVTFWHNVAHGATDACVAQMATVAAATVTAGTEFIIEYTNEPWDFNAAFTQFVFMGVMARNAAVLTSVSTPPNPLTAMGFGPRALNPAEFYVLRSAQVRHVFQAAWTSAGRSEPVRLVLNAQSPVPSMTSAYLAYAATHDIFGADTTAGGYGGPGPIPLAGDGICIAPYYDLAPRNNYVTSHAGAAVSGDPNSPQLPQALVDGLTLEQYEDVGDLNFRYPTFNPWHSAAPSHKAAIASSSHPDKASIRLHCYEGGPGYCGLKDKSPQQMNNSLSGVSHPRHRKQFLAYLKAMDDNGVGYFADFGFAFGLGPEGDGPEGPGPAFSTSLTLYTNYTTYYAMGQQSGVGDGSDGRGNNLTPGRISDAGTGLAVRARLDQVVSTRGQAVLDWNAVAAVASNPSAFARRHARGKNLTRR